MNVIWRLLQKFRNKRYLIDD